MSREAMKLALEALEGMYIQGFTQDDSPINNAITALREALAEQPYAENFIDALKYDVAKRDFWEGYVPEPDKRQQALDKKAENARELGLDYEPVCNKDPQGCWNVRCQLGKKCKNTPAQRAWVGLSDEERKLVRNSVGYNQFVTAGEYAEHVQKATEFKLREKNT